MKYNFELIRLSKPNKFIASFHCEHCGQRNMFIGACLYNATLKADPNTNLHDAASEFVDNINSRKFDLFANKKAGKNLKSAVCNCSVNVVCIKAHKAKIRAHAILKKGLHQLHKKNNKG